MWVYVGHCSLPGEVARFPIKTTRESRCAADRWQVSTTSCETVQFSGADSVMVRCAGLCGVGMIPRWIPFFACAYKKTDVTWAVRCTYIILDLFFIQGFQCVQHERWDFLPKQTEKRQNLGQYLRPWTLVPSDTFLCHPASNQQHGYCLST